MANLGLQSPMQIHLALDHPIRTIFLSDSTRLRIVSSPHHLQVFLHHLSYQILKLSRCLPSELLLRLSWVAKEKLHLCWSEILRIDTNQDTVLILSIYTNLIHSSCLPLPLDRGANNRESLLHELTNRVSLASRQHVIISLILLKHHPHALNIVAGMAPIALGINIAKVQAFVNLLLNPRHSCSDLTCHECAATTRRLVVEKDTIRKVHPICLTVVHQNPESILLGHSVWGAGVEGSRLALGHLLNLSVQLRCRGLVKSHLLFHAARPNGIEHTQDTNTITISSIFWHVKGHLNVRHGAKVVYFGGANLGNNGDEIGGIAEVAVVQVELNTCLMPIFVNVVDTACVEGGGSADDAVNLVSLAEEELRQI
mmetsp:Transcript_42810/g.130196  ORF Transcript_42810/g.130196 Transcript_42810/m.130196 type:complete len:369 (+) Transcript_42810:193-1299(+)